MKIPQEMRPTWTFRHHLAVIDGIILKGKCIIMPKELQEEKLEQLHRNHMGIEKKTRLLAWSFIYGSSMQS